MYLVRFSKQADKDIVLLKRAGLGNNVKRLLDIIMINPFQYPQEYEKLLWDLRGCFSRRINIQHRLVYEVLETLKISCRRMELLMKEL